jgi:hypothetical protein
VGHSIMRAPIYYEGSYQGDEALSLNQSITRAVTKITKP